MVRALEEMFEDVLNVNITCLKNAGAACRYVMWKDIMMVHLHPISELLWPMYKPDINLPDGLLRLQWTKFSFLFREVQCNSVVDKILHGFLYRPVCASILVFKTEFGSLCCIIALCWLVWAGLIWCSHVFGLKWGQNTTVQNWYNSSKSLFFIFGYNWCLRRAHPCSCEIGTLCVNCPHLISIDVKGHQYVFLLHVLYNSQKWFFTVVLPIIR
jgi:hypothetical protein